MGAEERVFDFFLIALASTFLPGHYKDGFPILKFLDKINCWGCRCRKEVKHDILRIP